MQIRKVKSANRGGGKGGLSGGSHTRPSPRRPEFTNFHQLFPDPVDSAPRPVVSDAFRNVTERWRFNQTIKAMDNQRRLQKWRQNIRDGRYQTFPIRYDTDAFCINFADTNNFLNGYVIFPK